MLEFVMKQQATLWSLCITLTKNAVLTLWLHMLLFFYKSNLVLSTIFLLFSFIKYLIHINIYNIHLYKNDLWIVLSIANCIMRMKTISQCSSKEYCCYIITAYFITFLMILWLTGVVKMHIFSSLISCASLIYSWTLELLSQ